MNFCMTCKLKCDLDTCPRCGNIMIPFEVYQDTMEYKLIEFYRSLCDFASVLIHELKYILFSVIFTTVLTYVIYIYILNMSL
jgi:hypothetical protein